MSALATILVLCGLSILGSVADHVVRHAAHASVLLVRAHDA